MLGVALGLVLRHSGVCAVGFVAVHLLVLWFDVLVRYVCECSYKRSLSAHVERNHAFLRQTNATSAPRHVIPRASSWGHVGLALAGGVCDGLAAALQPAPGGDSYALSLAAVLLCQPRTRWMPGVALLYVMLTVPVPGVHGVLRALLLMAGAVLCHGYAHVAWQVLRVAVGVSVLGAHGGPCASKSVPPVLLLAFALYRARANPALVLTFAALVAI